MRESDFAQQGNRCAPVIVPRTLWGSGAFWPAEGYQPGGPGDIVVVRLMYQWPVYASLLGFNLGDMAGNKRLIMATAGVDLDREVRIVQAGGQLERVAAVRNGAAQATLVEPPFAQQAEGEGLRLLADTADMRISYPITALVMNRQPVSRSRGSRSR